MSKTTKIGAAAVNPVPTVLVEGVGLLEGPIWYDGGLEFVSVNRGLIYRLEGDELSTLVETGGGPNGLCIDRNGVRWVAQNGGTRVKSRSAIQVPPSLQRIEAGRVEQVVTDGIAAPNDCAVGPTGLIWFTDPPWFADDRIVPGNVYAYDAAGKFCAVAISGIEFPNGLAFSPDAESLFLVETATHRILRFEVRGANALPKGTHVEIGHGGPDGIALSKEGKMIVANGHGEDIVVVDPNGKIIQVIDLTEFGWTERYFPTNVCFGPPGSGHLYVTLASGGRVLRFETELEGLPLLG